MNPSCATSPQKSSSQPDRWALLLLTLQGQPWPELPALPGRLIVARDEPLPDDELADIDNPSELALCAGITRQAARQRLQKRAEQALKGNKP